MCTPRVLASVVWCSLCRPRGIVVSGDQNVCFTTQERCSLIPLEHYDLQCVLFSGNTHSNLLVVFSNPPFYTCVCCTINFAFHPPSFSSLLPPSPSSPPSLLLLPLLPPSPSSPPSSQSFCTALQGFLNAVVYGGTGRTFVSVQYSEKTSLPVTDSLKSAETEGSVELAKQRSELDEGSEKWDHSMFRTVEVESSVSDTEQVRHRQI